MRVCCLCDNSLEDCLGEESYKQRFCLLNMFLAILNESYAVVKLADANEPAPTLRNLFSRALEHVREL